MPLTYRNFRRYRQKNPGPTTNKAYKVWKGNGGRHYENFRWAERKNQNNNKQNFIKKFIPNEKKRKKN